MRRNGGIAASVMLAFVFVVSVPALAAEEGLIEVSNVGYNEDFTHADFARTVINDTEEAIDLAPRDLRTAEYPILTLVSITAGAFADGIWTIGTLGPGESAYIEYAGDNPAATTSTTATETVETTTTVATSVLSTATESTTTLAASSTTTTESLPYTGPNGLLAGFAITGLALIVIGISTLRSARD